MMHVCRLVLLCLSWALVLALYAPVRVESAVLFQESFEDGNFGARGWYDSSGGALSPTEHISGSARSLECAFTPGGTKCAGGSPGRHPFAETDSVYVSFWIKYSPSWTGSDRPYHPHMFYLLTDQSDPYSGLSWTRLTAYIEENEGTPALHIQDGQNIDTARIGQNLVPVTEYRAMAGCNGDSDGTGNGDCYVCGSDYCNGKAWKAGAVYFSNTPGPRYKGDWHRVEAYFKLNGVVNGKAVANGVVRYWFDGAPIIDRSNVMLRTGRYPNMRFNQFVVGPYIGDGSPVAQTFWIDDLLVATEPLAPSDPPPGPPTDLRLAH